MLTKPLRLTRRLKNRPVARLMLLLPVALAWPVQAAASCPAAGGGQVAQLLCQQPELQQLDQQLNQVYQQALAKATAAAAQLTQQATDIQAQPVRYLKAEQRGWLKGRDECWKATELSACVRQQYQYRIAQLQANYQLVAASGPVLYRCSDAPGSEVMVRFYPTNPASLIAERGDQVSFMLLQGAEDAAKESAERYLGRNESLSHQGTMLRLVWGYQAPELSCQVTATQPGAQ